MANRLLLASETNQGGQLDTQEGVKIMMALYVGGAPMCKTSSHHA